MESSGWRPDVLGPGFECRDLPLGRDEEGDLVATLVRARPPSRERADEPVAGFWRRLFGRATHLGGELPGADDAQPVLDDVDVLYVHGWSDYFFQRSLANFWTDRGARFFALDLRKYGRSLREGQTPGYIEDLADYDQEIGLALETMGHGDRPAQSDPHPQRRLVLLGHSTGGLVLSLWAASHPGRADALVLNSPWLEFQLSAAGRQLIAPLINLRARFNLREAAPQFDAGLYTRAQLEVGPLDELETVDPRWRPERSHPVMNGWLRAILAGHGQVARGLHLDVPILLLLSERSALPLRWEPALTSADSVLDVEAVAKAALRLGRSVMIDRIDGALHDVFLSRSEVRADAYNRIDRWLTGWARSRPAPARSELDEAATH